MKSFREYLTEAQGFVTPDGVDDPGRPNEDHTDQARRILGDETEGSIRKLLERGYVRYWMRNGEIDLNFQSGDPAAALAALAFLKAHHTDQRIYLDIDGYFGEHFFDRIGDANRVIRHVGNLRVESLNEATTTPPAEIIEYMRSHINHVPYFNGCAFILPDGTLLGTNGAYQHYTTIADLKQPWDLNDVLWAGVVRLVANGRGAHTGAPLTQIQSTLIVDAYRSLRPEPDEVLAVDVFYGMRADHKLFDDRVTASALRQWVNSHF